MPAKTDKELQQRWMQFEGSYRLKCAEAGGEKIPISPKRKKLLKNNTANFGNYNTSLQTLLPKRKKNKVEHKHEGFNITQPIPTIISIQGPQWDGENLTCALDTVIACIQHLYTVITPAYREQLIQMSPWIKEILSRNTTINRVRDQLLDALHMMSPEEFPMGAHPKSLTDVMDSLFNSAIDDCFIFTYHCDQNQENFERETSYILLNIPHALGTENGIQISSLIGFSHRCLFCRQYHQCKSLNLKLPVPLLLISYDVTNSLNHLPRSMETSGSIYHLHSIMYYKDGHFTSALFSDNNTYWYDGMKNNGVPTPVHNLQHLLHHDDHSPVIFVYSL